MFMRNLHGQFGYGKTKRDREELKCAMRISGVRCIECMVAILHDMCRQAHHVRISLDQCAHGMLQIYVCDAYNLGIDHVQKFNGLPIEIRHDTMITRESKAE
jgi:hypothetical protein